MFVELNNMCNINAGGVPSGKCILIDGSHGTDSSFVLHHFVSMYAKSGYNVCFLGLSQSFNHYNSVGNKLGVSLSNARENGNLVFIEGLKLIGEDILRCESETETDGVSHAGHSGDLIHFDSTQHNDLKNLYQHCKYCIKDLATKYPDKPLLLVVDDISILPLLGIPHMDVIYFITYMRSLMTIHKGGLLIQMQCDTAGDDEDLDTICQHVKHQSDTVFLVAGLPSGYCKDVHGQVTVYTRSATPGETPVTSRSMQYKIQDKAVTFFPVGLSSAVL